MTEHVGVFDEFGPDCVDGQLKFAEIFLIEGDVDEDVLSALLQPVLHAHYLQQFGLSLRKRLHFLEDFEDFSFFG